MDAKVSSITSFANSLDCFQAQASHIFRCFQNNVEIHIAHVRSGMEHNFLSGFEVSSNISEC